MQCLDVTPLKHISEASKGADLKVLGVTDVALSYCGVFESSSVNQPFLVDHSPLLKKTWAFNHSKYGDIGISLTVMVDEKKGVQKKTLAQKPTMIIHELGLLFWLQQPG